jgi:methionyl-tRNA formyltransferase
MALKLLLLGTGTFALPAFQALCASTHQVAGIVTQPDKTGPGHHNHENPLKTLGESLNIPVFQPAKINTPESLETLKNFEADLFVVAAYGQILSSRLLAIPRLGAINLHGSLLPKYRGAAPVQYSVWKGETETGVTIFQIEPTLDSGPMLGVVKTPLGFEETSGELHDRLAELSAPLAVHVVDQLDQQTAIFETQDITKVTLAPKIPKDAGIIQWSQSALEIHNHIRAMQPWPKAHTTYTDAKNQTQRLVIYRVGMTDIPTQSAPGTIEKIEHGKIYVATGDQLVTLEVLQPAGKKAMSSRDFLNGTSLATGTTFFNKEIQT